MEGTERLVKTVPFISVMSKYVRTVLQEIELDNAHKLSLRIMGTILKPVDLFSSGENQVKFIGNCRVPANIIEESGLFY